MKKKIGILCGITGGLVLASLVAATLANTSNSIINKLINPINGPKAPLNTFVIDENTEFQKSEDLYYGVALSTENHINTKFVGFEKDNESGKLYVPANTTAYITNVEPINRGFQEVAYDFAALENTSYSATVFFSYYPLNIDDIAAGQYADLLALSDNFRNTNLDTYIQGSVGAPTFDLSDYRYVLTFMHTDKAITLESISFETPCLEDATDPEGIGTRSDYRANEKSWLNTNYGELIPFIGHGAYMLSENQGALTGNFLTLNKANAFKTALLNDGYELKLENYNGGDLYQKDIPADSDNARTIYMRVDNLTGSFPFTMYLAGSYPKIVVTNDWPEDDITGHFSSGFATIINAHPVEYTGINYMFNENDYSNYLIGQVILTGFDINRAQVISDVLTPWLNAVKLAHPEFSHSSTYDHGEDYQESISTDFGLKTIGFSVSGDSYSVYFQEKSVLSSFPEAGINESLNAEVEDNHLACLPYVDGTGQTLFDYSDGSNYLRLYNAPNTALEDYKQSLIAAGYTVDSHGSNFTAYGSALNEVQVNVYTGVYDEATYLEMSFQPISYITIHEYNSFSEMLNGVYDGEDLITNHEYPAIVGDHVYKFVENGYSMPYGMYVDGLGQAYIDQLLDGATYNPYYNAYYFPSEHDENDNYFAITSQMVLGGILIRPMTIKLDTNLLITTSTANTYIEEYFDDVFGYLKDTDMDEYNARMADIVPLNTGYATPCIKMEQHTSSFQIYGNDRTTLLNNFISGIEAGDYEYSSFQKKYVNPSTGAAIKYQTNTNEYGAEYIEVTYEFGVSAISFVNYTAANLSDIESLFVSIPHDEKACFIHVPADYGGGERPADYMYETVIVSDEYNVEAFTDALTAAGFESDGMEEYTKLDGSDYYRVSVRDHYYDNYQYQFDYETGYHAITFEYRANYYKTYSNAYAYIQSNVSSQDILDAFALFENEGLMYHLYSVGDTLIEMDYHSNSLFDYQAFCEEVAANTDYELRNYSELYYYDGTHYNVISITGSHIRINFQIINWTTKPDKYLDFDLLYYRHNDNIVLPDETGAIYSVTMSTPEEFNFMLKNTVDLDTYRQKLEDFGYEPEKGSDYYRLDLGGDEIYCQISDEGLYYQVRFYNYNYMPKMDYTVDELNRNAWANGYDGADIFPSGYTFEDIGYTILEERDNGSYTYWFIYLMFNSSDDYDAAAATLIDGFTYLDDSGNIHIYQAQDENYAYNLFIYEGDNAIAYQVIAKTTNP